MNKLERLQAAGWRVGDYGDFLGLTDEERTEVERRAQAAQEEPEDNEKEPS